MEECTRDEYDRVVRRTEAAFVDWRSTPAPRRGEIVWQIGPELRRSKEALGRLVSYEMGKIFQEGLGEVQEVIDTCDFAVGQSRMLYGKTIHSERPEHRLYEQWHPLGPRPSGRGCTPGGATRKRTRRHRSKRRSRRALQGIEIVSPSIVPEAEVLAAFDHLGTDRFQDRLPAPGAVVAEPVLLLRRSPERPRPPQVPER